MVGAMAAETVEAMAEEMAVATAGGTEGATPQKTDRAAATPVAIRRGPGVAELLSAAMLPGSACAMPMA
ncbi:hypothetical protein BC360_21350 [Ensifer sp. LC163]|nr:hypothetical protein BC361_18875 [Ensifer sp. LC54]OCP25213.1 hypothetical protein BC363_20275 [Ensifer sp. LC384]OCP37636.1 hypothetical protein BC360_21350 [Ensifer sp. LC163]